MDLHRRGFDRPHRNHARAGESGNPVRFAAGPVVTPQHDAAYWDAVTAGFDFSEADQVPPAQFNRVLWTGLMNGKPYPTLGGQASGTKDEK
jgi:hypothetical protein